MQLKKRFFDCYKIDLISDDLIVSSLITNNQKGTVYQGELSEFNIENQSRFFSSGLSQQLFIDKIPFCFREKQEPSIFKNSPMKNTLEFTDGIFLTCSKNHLNYWIPPKVINYFYFGTIACQIKASRQIKYLREPFSKMDYVGAIEYSDQLNYFHLLSILQFLTIDHLFNLDR